MRVASWPFSRPHPGPATRRLSRHRVSGLRLACRKAVQYIYTFLCAHGLHRAVCVTSPSAGLGLAVLPCATLIAVFCAPLLCPVLCLCCRLGLSAAPAGIRTFPWKSGFCAYGKSRFRLRKTFVVFAALRPAGRESNGKIRGNFCSRLQKFPRSNSSIFRFRKFFWPLGRGAPSPYWLLACQ